MGFEVASAFVSLIPSLRGGGRTIGRELDGVADKAGKSSGRRFGRVFASSTISPLRAIGAAAVALFAVDKIKDFFGSAIDEAREAQKVSALTAQVIKTTGGVANVSAGHVGKLAEGISNLVGQDDELIQQGANLLLTFKNVRNEVGKGNAVFDRATQAAVDLSAAGFGDLSGTAKQLGKALNDPIKGISALGRAGVTFTEKQKEQIKALVESGNILAAQKIILGEVESQVGGAAAAQATAADKMSVAWANFKEDIGTALLPTIDSILTSLTNVLPKVLAFGKGIGNAIGPALQQVVPLVKSFVTGLQGGSAGGAGPFASMVAAGSKVREVFIAIAPHVKTLVGAFLTFGQTVGGMVLGILGRLAPLLGTLAPIFGQVAGFVKSLLPAFSQLGGAVGGFVTAMLPTLQKFAGQLVAVLGPGLKQIGTIISTQVVPALSAFLTAIRPVAAFILGVIGTAVIGALRGVITFIQGALKIISGIFTVFAGIFTGDWGKVWDGIKTIASGVWQAIKGAFQVFINIGIGKVFSLGGRLILGIGRKLWSGLGTLFTKGAIQLAFITGRGVLAVLRFFGSLPGKALGLLASLGSKLGSLFARAWTAARSAVSRGISNALNLVRSLPGRITRALGNLGNLLRSAGGKIIDGLVRGIRGAIGKVTGAVGDVMQAARDLLPFSPAKKGPFSGRGWTLYSGRAIVEGLAQGVDSRANLLDRSLTGALTVSRPSLGVAGGGLTALGGDTFVTVELDGQPFRSMVRVEQAEANRNVRRRAGAGVRR